MKDYDEVRGLRHNSDKLRYDLIPPIANREYAKVWTQALGKYPEGNWEKGMPWTEVIASATAAATSATAAATSASSAATSASSALTSANSAAADATTAANSVAAIAAYATTASNSASAAATSATSAATSASSAATSASAESFEGPHYRASGNKFPLSCESGTP